MAVNYQPPNIGFGSYLQDILPNDVAVSAGAFSMTMQQIRNIKNVDFEKFAQVASSIEIVNKDLTQVNGTDVPTNTALASAGVNLLALGSGPSGSYTASDMYGCMSGLPYSWNELQTSITTAQTTKLSNIYNQLFLAVTWEYAEVSVNYTSYTVGLDTYYNITGLTITNSGGGYGRGSAVAPLITINGGSGATAVCTIGTNASGAGSNNTGTFGRVTTVTLTSAGTDTTTIPTATIESPPIDTLAVSVSGAISTSGTNTTAAYAGWPSMNSVVSAYITQANTEINAISTTNPNLINTLNVVYNAAGNQLMIEQRTRYTALDPVPSPRDAKLNQYPLSLSVFTDLMSSLALNTYPHMYAQTLEAISDLSTPGGQSVVGLMRQERNAAKLQELGIPLDNDILGQIDENMCPVLISNGTVPTATAGIEVQGINGNINNPTTTYTVPSILLQETDKVIAPKPYGYFDPNTNEYIVVKNSTAIGAVGPIQSILNVGQTTINNTNLLGPSLDGTGPARQIGPPATYDSSSLQTGTTETPFAQPAAVSTEPIVVVKVGARVPTGTGSPLDIGNPTFLGSLAGSAATEMIPCTLNSAYTSSVLLPNTLSVQEAIDEVIKCNCDCWVD